MTRAVLEAKRWVALIVVFVYSMLAVVPSLIFPVLWRWQNRLVDWADSWAWDPMYRYQHPDEQ